jgi:hypothetical protein
MTGVQFAFIAYVVSGLLLCGYAVRLWLGLRFRGRRSCRAQRNSDSQTG